MQRNILILGGRSLVAPFLLKRLQARAECATVASRKALTLPQGFSLLSLALDAPAGWEAPEGGTILSLLPLWILAEHRALFAKAGRIVAVGSTSVFGKANSDDPTERATAEKLAKAESDLQAFAADKDIPLTILRPTLIYDGKTDANVTRIASMAKRYRAFPVAYPAKGLRQPIHADDVAAALLAAMDTPASAGKALNIAGGEILPYHEMVRRIFRSVGRMPILIPLPQGLLQTTYRLAARAGLLKTKGLGFGAFKRMNEDLVFETEEGLKLLNLSPRSFTQHHTSEQPGTISDLD